MTLWFGTLPLAPKVYAVSRDLDPQNDCIDMEHVKRDILAFDWRSLSVSRKGNRDYEAWAMI